MAQELDERNEIKVKVSGPALMLGLGNEKKIEINVISEF